MPLKKDLKKLKLALKELEAKPASNFFAKLIKKIKISGLEKLILRIELKLQDLKIQKQYNK
jgi:hypothetical protein